MDRKEIMNKIEKFSYIENFGHTTVYNSYYEQIKYIQINSLEDYVAFITKTMNSHSKLAFRGEADFFDKTEASIFRKRAIKNTPDSLKKEYYKEVGHTFLQIEKENFIAYSQHHGLPTELLDVTNSPLYALYFACNIKTSSNIGIVNIFNIEQTINFEDLKISETDLESEQLFDLSKMVYNYYYLGDFNKNPFKKVIPEFLDKNSTYAKRLLGEVAVYLNDLRKFCCNNTIKKNLNDRENYILNSISDLESTYTEYDSFYEFGINIIKTISSIPDDNSSIKKEIPFDIYQLNTSLIRVYLEIFGLAFSLFELALNEIIFPETNEIMLKYRRLDQSVAFKQFSENISLPPFPLIRYIPSVKFDRIRAQEGEFIYQPYYLGKKMILINGEESKKDTEMYLFPQLINPNIKLVIMDKEKVYRQLDFMGVNRKLMYPDSDNIATYLKDKYNEN